MSLSIEDINTINRTASAQLNRVYTDITGKSYKGLANGRLQYFVKAAKSLSTSDVQKLINTSTTENTTVSITDYTNTLLLGGM